MRQQELFHHGRRHNHNHNHNQDLNAFVGDQQQQEMRQRELLYHGRGDTLRSWRASAYDVVTASMEIPPPPHCYLYGGPRAPRRGEDGPPRGAGARARAPHAFGGCFSVSGLTT